MGKVRIGLIGCGRISKNHIDAIGNYPDEAEIVAVCDVKEERAKEAARITGGKPYTSYSELLENESIDLVSICTPSGLHPKHAIMAANKGVHVLSEKPMGTNLKLADDMIHACDEAGVRLFVVKQNRLNTTMQLVKRAIEEGRFGRIYMVTSNVFWTRPQNYYDMAPWRGTWEFDGGAFMNQASHYVDMLEWLIGPVESVMAYTATMERRIEAEDTGVAAIHFRNGAMGSMNVTMLTYPKNLEGSLTIIGEKGTVRVGGLAINKIEHWEFADYQDYDKTVFESNYTPTSVYGFGHTGYYRNVIDTLLGKAEPNTDGREGRNSLELILAIYRSAKTQSRVALPLDM